MQAFGPEGETLGLSELARRASLPKATAYRLATQLVDLGILERSGDSYRLGLPLFELGHSVERQRRLKEAALPFMEDLYEATHETIHLGVIHAFEVLYLEKIAGRRQSAVGTRVGTRKPLHCTGLGKAILAYSPPDLIDSVISAGLAPQSFRTITVPHVLRNELANIRRTGVAFDHEEHTVGFLCVASPLIDRTGLAHVALSITGPETRFTPEHSAAAVRTAALGLTRALDGSPWPS